MSEAEGRSKRQSKQPSWIKDSDADPTLSSDGEDDPASAPPAATSIEAAPKENTTDQGTQEPTKIVFRVLDENDVNSSLLGREVFVLWPDDGTWYRGKIRKFNPSDATATIYYEDTEEKEDGAQIGDMVASKEVAFKEVRPVSHLCGIDEVENAKEYVNPSKKEAKRGRPAGGQATIKKKAAAQTTKTRISDDFVALEDSGSDEDGNGGEESDPSFDSTDVAGKRRSRKSKRHSDYVSDIDSDDADGGLDDEDDLPLSRRKKSSGGGKIRRVAGGSSARKVRKQHGHDDPTKEDEEEEDVVAPRVLARATGRKFGSPPQPQYDAAVRSKVRAGFQAALEQAENEIRQEGTDSDDFEALPAPSLVASAVEDALVRLFDGTTKEYKEKTRTLTFNLKNPHNTELRAHVLRGDIPPDAFVRMTATELASKELAEYRKMKEEEALKMSVLDAEAAAKFSTAAALDARDTLGLPGQTAGPLVTDPVLAVRDTSPTHRDGGAAATLTPNTEDAPPTADTAPAPPAASIDWASIKAQAASTMNTTPTSPLFHGELPHIEAMGLVGHALHDDASGDASAVPTNTDSLERILLPNSDPAALGPGVWEAEVVIPGSGSFLGRVHALAGCGDLASLLGNAPLHVRGRVGLAKIDEFLSDLHLSKHRTATVGLLSATPDSNEAEIGTLSSLVELYANQDRVGVAEPGLGGEAYLLPSRGPLARRLLDVSQRVQPQVAAQGALPKGTDASLLVVVVHKRDLAAIPGNHQNVRLPRGAAGGQYAPHSTTVAAQQDIPPPAAATGLDLSAISALAAAYGVDPGTAPAPAPSAPQIPNLSGIAALAAAYGVGGEDTAGGAVPMVSAYQQPHQGGGGPRPMAPYRPHPR